MEVKPKVEEVEAKVKMSTGQFEVKTIGLRKRRPKKYRCRICKDVVDSVGERNRHMAEKHGLNEFKCRQYDEKFTGYWYQWFTCIVMVHEYGSANVIYC